MRLDSATVVLRERSALEVVDLTFRFVRALAPGLMLRLAAWHLLPAFAALMFVRYGLGASWWLVWPLAFVISLLLELPFTIAAGRLLFEPELDLRVVLSETMSTLLRHGVAQVALVIANVLSLALVFGPLFVSSVYCFVPEVLTLERASVSAGFRRARRLLRGRSGTGVETVILRFALLLAFVTVGELCGSALVGFVFEVGLPVEALFEDGGSPFSLFGLLLAVPYRATYRFLSYANERTRQDGWDVQVALLALDVDSRQPNEEAA